MGWLHGGEEGQTMVEFGIICTVMLMLSLGLVDVGRAFYEYNALAAAAHYAARWGSVVGGSCTQATAPSVYDWCNQIGGTSSSFWVQAGNAPLQTGGSACPSTYSSAYSSDYYQASNYIGSSATTIVGAVVQRFDTNGSTSSSVGGTKVTSFSRGSVTPGFNLKKLYVCIQLSSTDWNSVSNTYEVRGGDVVTVYLYYPFQPAGPLLGGSTFNLVASAAYSVEG